jgi:hypothetical protein
LAKQTSLVGDYQCIRQYRHPTHSALPKSVGYWYSTLGEAFPDGMGGDVGRFSGAANVVHSLENTVVPDDSETVAAINCAAGDHPTLVARP